MSVETENTPDFRPELVAVFGRGIERMCESGDFRPSSLFERWDLSEQQRVGLASRHDHFLGNESNLMVGGGNSNVLAAVHYLNTLDGVGGLPNRLIFSAGRPDYLRQMSKALSEGDIMKRKYLRLAKFYGLPKIGIKVFRSNKNTKDDVWETIQYAKGAGMHNLAILAVRPHVLRIKEFIKSYKDTEKGFFPNIEINDSWSVLEKVDPRFGEVFNYVMSSDAYKKTIELEERGILALRKGTYESRRN